jgi:uncharacterized delta-60 repeat protein
MRFRAALMAVFVLATPRFVDAFSGALDVFFGSSGRTTTEFGGSATARAVVLQRDGKLVAVGGVTTTDATGFALARYDTDGRLDSFFGGGRVSTSFADGAAEAFAALVQPDGRVVAVGRASGGFAVARYDTDGSLDAFFGAGGRVSTSFGGDAVAFGVALQADGRLVAVGAASGRFALARYDADGSLDPFFGGGGRVTTSFAGDATAAAVAVQPDGKLVTVGHASNGTTSGFALARHDSDGTLDPFFGSSGRVVTGFAGDAEALALVLQPDGKVVAAGRVSDGVTSRFALARYAADGSLDPFFGSQGRVVTTFSGDAAASALVIQPDGRLIAVGRASSGGTRTFALARYDDDGTLDPSFGSGGRVITSFPGDAEAHATALGTDGRLVAAGGVSGADRSDFALARYEAFTVCSNGSREIVSPGDEGTQDGTQALCATGSCVVPINAPCIAQAPPGSGTAGPASPPSSVAEPPGQPSCRGGRMLRLLERRVERARMLIERSAAIDDVSAARTLATRAARLLRRVRRASVRARRTGRLSPTCAAAVIEMLRAVEQHAGRP